MSLFHAGTVPAFDSDGNPIVGAVWYFYLTGTTTPTPAYTDSACTVSGGSSVTSGSGGRFAVRFVDDAVATRAVLKDSAGGTTLLDIDPVTVSAAGGGTIVASVDVSGGATGLSFTGGPITSSGTITASGTLDVDNGGTGATTATNARNNLSAAKSGTNTDITSLEDGTTIAAGGTIAADSIGYRGIPANAKTASYTLALTDAGKHISITTGGVVIPANGSVAFPVGSWVTVYNDSASTQTISITTDTLRWAGTTSTGSRTLAAYGWATLAKVASTTWTASGNLT